MLPDTRRNDVSPTELQLRRQDKAARNLRYFEVFVLALVVIFQILILFRVLENSNYNRSNIENHRHQTEQLIETNAQNVEALEDLICDIILALKQPTDGQRKACDGKGTN